MEKRVAITEFTKVSLKANEPFYLPLVNDETIKSISFKDKGLSFKISVVEEFKEITSGNIKEKDSTVLVNLKTKCLVVSVNADTVAEILTLK
ncbi:hypothetical protein [Tenacibaculum salmonis]|uniref:hypothetical protein n=1 Tax=Tenacibaculum sp. P3-BQ1 TaxID=3232310 RepID=UPI0034DFA61A